MGESLSAENQVPKTTVTVPKPPAWYRRVLAFRESTILVPLLLMIVIVGIINPVFFSYYNFISVARAVSLTAIVAMGMTFVLVARELDLSVGSILGLSSVTAGWVLVRGAPILVGILVGVFTGVLLGFANGLMIIRLRIPSLIVTLGTMYAARGCVYVITSGRPIYPMPQALQDIGVGKIAGVPNAVYVLIVIAVLAHFILTRTVFGREVRAIGGNPEAARVTGINTDRVRLAVFLMTGFCSGIAGVLLLGRLNSAEPGAGVALEMTVIASTIIGGTSLFGGYGTIPGTVIGTILTGIMVSALVLLHIPAYYEQIVVGIIIIVAVTMDQYQRRRLLRSAS
jgi:ribose/xylose/arabinose/galactoside ABC-type transport system permease subunit